MKFVKILGSAYLANALQQKDVSTVQEKVAQSIAQQSTELSEFVERDLSFKIEYPKAKKDETFDIYKTAEGKSVKVADPYRWLENPDSPETQAWITAQRNLTDRYFNETRIMKKITKRMASVEATEALGMPVNIGGTVYFEYMPKNGAIDKDGKEMLSKYYRTRDVNFLETNKGGDLSKGAEVAFDPNKNLNVGKDSVSFDKASFSDNGRYWAYSIQSAGSDWERIKVRDMNTLSDFNDELKWVKFSSIEWTSDSKGFFYTRFDKPKDETVEKAGSGTQKLEFAKLMYHRVGTSQDKDVMVHHNPKEPEEQGGIQTTIDNNYALLFITKGTNATNKLLYADMTDKENAALDKELKFNPIIDDWIGSFNYITNHGTKFFF